MYKLKSVIDGLPATTNGGAARNSDRSVAQSRYNPISIDDIVPVDEDPKEYLEGRVAFYIALLEELIRRGAASGDIYFMKECVDALLKMTTIGRAKVDLNVGGGLSKLRDEIDFTKMETAELEAFVSKAKGEVNGRAIDYGSGVDGPGDVSGGMVHSKSSRPSNQRRRKARDNGSSKREAGADATGSGSPDAADFGPGSAIPDLP